VAAVEAVDQGVVEAVDQEVEAAAVAATVAVVPKGSIAS